MQLLSTKTQPGLRRVLDAFGKVAFEYDAAPAPYDWRASFADGQRNVIKHFRHVLATQRMAPAERQALLDRIARIEDKIRAVEEPQTALRKEAA